MFIFLRYCGGQVCKAASEIGVGIQRCSYQSLEDSPLIRPDKHLLSIRFSWNGNWSSTVRQHSRKRDKQNLYRHTCVKVYCFDLFSNAVFKSHQLADRTRSTSSGLSTPYNNIGWNNLLNFIEGCRNRLPYAVA